MKTKIRPSRRWPKLFKYYLVAFFFMVPFLFNFVKGLQPGIISTFVNYFNMIPGSEIFLSYINFVDSFSWPLFIVGLFLVVVAEIKRFRVKYVFYDDRIVKEVGLFITDIKDVSYDHIDYFHTKRSIAQRILGTADLHFKTPGDPESMVLEGVGKPERWAEFIMKKANILE